MPHRSFKIKAESISTFGTNGLIFLLIIFVKLCTFKRGGTGPPNPPSGCAGVWTQHRINKSVMCANSGNPRSQDHKLRHRKMHKKRQFLA